MIIACIAAAAAFWIPVAQSAASQAPAAPPTAAQPAAAQPAAKLDRNDPNRVLCRKEQIPGPLARYKKVCKPKAEWDQQDKQQGEEEL